MIRVGSSEDHGLALDVIQIDGGTQSRATLNDQVVNEYAEAIKAGTTFPPIVVFYDGKKHWLADGFHRFHAYQKAGKTKVAADIRQGTRRDAILFSVGANETHGLRRTRDDKRRAVLTLLNDAEWGQWTDREIARRCAVSPQTVANVRADTVQNGQSDERTYVHPKTGKPTTMKTAGINASRTQFQAKASEDNGSITGGAGAVTGEASRLASGRTDAGEVALVDLPTNPDAEPKEITPDRSIFKELVALWKIANEGDRQDFKAYIRGSEAVAELNREFSDGMASGSEHHSAARNGATMEQSDVDGSAAARTPAGEDSFALAGQIETRTKAEIVDGNASLAAREGEKPLHSNSPSDDDAFSEVKGTARPESAAGVEPSLSEPEANPPSPPPASGNPFPDPHSQRLTTGGLHTSSDDAGAKSNGLHSVVGQGGGEPGIHHSQSGQQEASATHARNEPGSASGATVTNPKPFCLKLKDGHCKIAFETAALCAQCNAAKARAA